MNKRLYLTAFILLQLIGSQCLAADFVVVRNIFIKGNTRTKETIILRELKIHKGDTLQKENLEQVLEIERKKIVNTNLFVTVKISTEEEEQQINVIIEVKERLYFVVLPVFYLADRNFNEWWYERKHDLRRTIYGIYSKHGNLTGNNDQLRIRAELGFIPNFEISYTTPYLDRGLKTGISTGIFYSVNKTMTYRTWRDKLQFYESEQRQRERLYIYSVLTRRTGFYQTQAFELSYNRTQIGDSIARFNPDYFLKGRTEQKYFLAGYSYVFDKRDNRQYALKGIRVALQAVKYGLLNSDNINLLSLGSSYAHYFPIGGNFYGNITLRGKVSFPKKQPFLQTVGLGYRNDLVRGYELYVIDGQNYGLVKTNFKYRFFDRTFDISKYLKIVNKYLKIKQFNTFPIAAYLNTFFDVGYIRNYYPELNNTRLANKWLAGGGVGLDIVTWYNMVGRLNYSVNGLNEKRLFFTVTRDF